jgi:hypothetical protein
MTAITASVERVSRGSRKQTMRFLMTASTTIPKGALVSLGAATGLALNAVSGAVDPIVGVAAETMVSAASGNYYIEVEFDCEFRFTASSVNQAAVGDVMLVVDNNTVDETSAGSAAVGLMTELVSGTTECWVYVPGLTGKHAV